MEGVNNSSSAYIDNSLDAGAVEPFTCKSYYELVADAHAKKEDYYIARVRCVLDPMNTYYCYDAKHLCKFIFETVVGPDGRKIKIKNFKDPIVGSEIAEICFFKLRHEMKNPLRAEPVGNHVTFLESNVFRKRIFREEDPLDSLSVNFQSEEDEKKPTFLSKRKIIKLLMCFMAAIVIITISFFVIIQYKAHRNNKKYNKHNNKANVDKRNQTHKIEKSHKNRI
ncbi:hypothetical protein A0H76_1227 [Hepatospora eriocheir]|uniref:Uncharacterized protein n=1 Tax=Hepatospora eriocheir TaxID=1081669 RepID=A0A1X0QBQ1_9MICR|nr:hypothetical protein HERIO_907 [Hepatospora eriocheir]ORD99204.1 hypothetical protein A0H76_1227 [Hepatospora eriocheir]